MPVFKLVFFKLLPDADPALVQEWIDVSKTMPAKISCVRQLFSGRPLAGQEAMAQGWDLATCVELDSFESSHEFYGHPDHDRPRELFNQVCDRTKTYSMVFELA
ncbi:hypothetical protein B0O99DRAFT_696675 [Bisporella sp. PMI_857]|nr:hypothetical protein B0O99DRAFT_696675 [Bisporella sp. PMI_857]